MRACPRSGRRCRFLLRRLIGPSLSDLRVSFPAPAREHGFSCRTRGAVPAARRRAPALSARLLSFPPLVSSLLSAKEQAAEQAHRASTERVAAEWYWYLRGTLQQAEGMADRAGRLLGIDDNRTGIADGHRESHTGATQGDGLPHSVRGLRARHGTGCLYRPCGPAIALGRCESEGRATGCQDRASRASGAVDLASQTPRCTGGPALTPRPDQRLPRQPV